MTLGTYSALGVGLGLSLTQHIVVVGVDFLANVVDRDDGVSWKKGMVDVECAIVFDCREASTEGIERRSSHAGYRMPPCIRSQSAATALVPRQVELSKL